MGATITTRVPDEIEKDIEFFVKIEKLDRSTLTRKLLAKALTDKKLEYALERYSKKEISLWKAASLANVPLSRFIEVLKEKNIALNYTEIDLEEDIKGAENF